MIDVLLMLLLLFTSVFLILLVLVQRGRGGGLAGAFGGMGGQSAFGTKAGDLFTRITIFTATFWIILCAFSVKWFSEANSTVIAPGMGQSAPKEPVSGGTPAAGGTQTPDAKAGATGKAKSSAAGATGAGGDAKAASGTDASSGTEAAPGSAPGSDGADKKAE